PAAGDRGAGPVHSGGLGKGDRCRKAVPLTGRAGVSADPGAAYERNRPREPGTRDRSKNETGVFQSVRVRKRDPHLILTSIFRQKSIFRQSGSRLTASSSL